MAGDGGRLGTKTLLDIVVVSGRAKVDYSAALAHECVMG